MGASPHDIRFDPQRIADIKEAITKSDIRILIGEKAIKKYKGDYNSRSRARKLEKQKSKGLRKGHGSREGTKTARVSKKDNWMNKIRIQRKFAKELKDNGNITSETYRDLYYKSKGGYFRSKRHMKVYLEDKELFVNKEK